METDREGHGPWGRLSRPWKWSVGLGIVLPVLGWLPSGDFSAFGIVALLVVILIWTGALRLIIFVGQFVTGKR